MNILWSDQAAAAFWAIRDDIFNRFGIEAENEFVEDADKTIKQVAAHPNIGTPEYELSPEGDVQSILVHKLSRIVYYFEGDNMYIADVWATRQDPHNLISRFQK